MKQLICEMCGSTDLVKQDGVFVCQTCGCKYSVEEAKKMMIEGTVDVSGSTVKIDTSDKLKNLYTLARRAREDNNIQDAAKYYHEIRLEDPNSWEAAFYGVYFTALDCRIGQIESAAHSITNTIDTCSALIQKYVPENEQKEAYTELFLRTLMAGQILFNGAKNTYDNSTYDDARSDFIGRASACLLTMTAAGVTAEEIFNDYSLAETIYLKVVEMCNSCHVTKSFTQIPEKRLEQLKPKLRTIQQKKNNEYWEEHIEEKTRLESEKHELEIQVATIKNEIDEIPETKQVDELNRQLSDLQREKDGLGLFKIKEKKFLQVQIDSKKEKLNEVNNIVNTKINEINERIKPIQNRIDEINTELTRDR